MLNPVQIDNILKLLRRGKWELQGEEILAFHQCFSYLVKLLDESKKPAIQTAVVEEPIKKSKKEKKI